MYKNIFCKIILVFSLLNADVVLSANLVKNGDFENGSNEWTEWTSTQPWVNGELFEHDYSRGSDIWIPDPYPFAGLNTHSQRKGVGNIHGGIYQVINVTKGKTYTLSGQWSGGIGGLVLNSNTIAAWFEVTVYDGVASAAQIDAGPGGNDVIIAKRTHAGNTIYSFGWETFSGDFTAKSNQITLALKTGKIGDWDAIAAYHDNISIYEFNWSMFVPAITGKKTLE